ncbi:MAG: hypothetical protein KJZ93_23905 [Caldilineaceae bacterium]|nr:hypothetical protein [Caldilineaceae bacterium]
MRRVLFAGGSVRLWRLPLLALALISMLSAAWAGLIRLGWGWPYWADALPAAHGPLMIGGFLGALIGLERAVALGRRWAYLAPGLAATGGALGFLGAPAWLAALAITGASLALLAVMAAIWRIHPTLFSAVIAAGVALWLAGNGLWLAGQPIAYATPWWMGFLILTIAGERLELSRMLRLPAAVTGAFLAAIACLLIGLLWSLMDFGAGMRVAGGGMALLALWLLRYDIAWRRVKAGGQARCISFSLLSGYVWLAVGGLLTLWLGGVTAGPYYDAMLHTVLLGFVFAMIFAHAPIIFPAVLQLPVAYTPWFYSHLVVLHLGLSLRVVGDLALWMTGRQWGGLVNAVALLLFLFNTVNSIRSSVAHNQPAPRVRPPVRG